MEEGLMNMNDLSVSNHKIKHVKIFSKKKDKNMKYISSDFYF